MSTKRTVTSRMTLDVVMPDIQKTITVTQGDINRRLEITLVDNGKPFQLGVRWTVVLAAVKPSGAKIYNSCTVSQGKIIYDFAGGPEIATEAGAFDVQFDIYDEVGDVLASPKIWISVLPNKNREMQSEDQFTATQDILRRINETEAEKLALVQAAVDDAKEVETEIENAEALRVTAEGERVKAEAARVQAEKERVTAESGRVTAEAARVTAEGERVKAEAARVQAEKARVTAEGGRVTAENTRETNETAREALRDDLLRIKKELEELIETLPTDAVELIELINRVNAVLDSDDETLDELSEIVAYIKSNKSLIEAITTSKVSVADIVDNLQTQLADKPLSANQGVVLKGMVETAQNTAEGNKPASKITAGTFAGAVVANSSGQTPETSLLRNSKLVSTETNPTVNGEICWTYA